MMIVPVALNGDRGSFLSALLCMVVLFAGARVQAADGLFSPGTVVVPVYYNNAYPAERLGIAITTDNFATLHDITIGAPYADPVAGSVRDPSIIRFKGGWFVCYTQQAFAAGAHDTFGVAYSADLTSWTFLASVRVPGTQSNLWAPSWFFDPRTNSLYITVSREPVGLPGHHQPMWAEVTAMSGGGITVGAWSPMAGVGEGWDHRVESDGASYYVVYSNGGPGLQIYRAGAFGGTYSFFSNPPFSAAYSEQCKLYWISGTRWAVTYLGGDDFKIYRRFSDDGMATWGNAQALLTPVADPGFRSFNQIIEFQSQSFGGWKAQNFTLAEQQDVNVSGPNADPDHDGRVNLLEYALHLLPRKPEADAIPLVAPIAPGDAFITLTYRRLVGAGDLQYTVQESVALTPSDWSPAAGSEDIVYEDGNVQVVRARVPAGTLGRKFLRVQVLHTN